MAVLVAIKQMLLSNLTEEVITVFGFGLCALVLVYLRDKISKALNVYEIRGRVMYDQSVQEVLTEIRVRMHAQRCFVFLFHNGTYYTNGDSMLRMSCAYETVEAGVASILSAAQDILLSTVPQSVAFLVKHDCRQTPAFYTTASIEPSYYRGVMELQGVRAVACQPLCQADDIVGFVGVHFTHTSEVSADELHVLSQQIGQLQILVNKNKQTRSWLWRQLRKRI